MSAVFDAAATGGQPAPGAADPPAYLASLNPEQCTAALHAADDGPLLVIAGAGSGKTNTLAHRVAHLVFSGADPQRILLLTFSRRAAAEMERRVGQIINRVLGAPAGQRPPVFPWAGTFHGVGARLLREVAEQIGLSPDFTIHDRADAEDMLALVRHDLGLDATRDRFPTKATCLAIYSRAVNSEADLSAVLRTAFPWCAQWEAELAELFESYVAAKQAQHVLDYDDLLLYWVHLMQEPALAAQLRARFDHILVDEYQDTNRLQASILLALRPDGRGLTVVGDDAQSIYSFRAATVRNILDFPRHFDPSARIVTLSRNYRSTPPILAASNAVIGLAPERYAKDLWSTRDGGQKPRLVSVADEAEQARCVAASVLAHREQGMALKAQAALFRTASHSAQLEIELVRRNIPFVKFGGLKFLEATHVKDVLSVLRWAQNPRNRIAGFRVVRLLPGIGPVSATRLLDAMDASADPLAAFLAFRMPGAAAEAWAAFAPLFAMLHRERSAWPAEVGAVARWYAPHLERLHDDAAVRSGDIDQLERIAATYASRERFLTELTLDPPEASSGESGVPLRDDDYMVLSTIHSAKGQEWRAVSILNVVDGCMPSDLATGSQDEIEEERRLLYVGMTRARDHLQLIVPQRFYVPQQKYGDRHVLAGRSRFISNAVARTFETCSWPPPPPLEPLPPSRRPPPAAIDMLARMRGQWKVR